MEQSTVEQEADKISISILLLHLSLEHTEMVEFTNKL